MANKEPADRAVEDASNLLIAMVRRDKEIFAASYRFRADLMGLVLPLLMIAKLFALYIAQNDPEQTEDDVFERYTLAWGAEEPMQDRAANDALRDGAAIALAWHRGDEDGFQRLLRLYSNQGELLASSVGNVAFQILASITSDPDEQESMIRMAGETVLRQIQQTMKDEG